MPQGAGSESKILTRFTEMSLSAGLQKRLAAGLFTIPTPVQAAAIPYALAGKDVLATSQTGTGKTLAFLIPIIERFQPGASHNVEALVLVPTRELAMQVHAQYEQLRGRALAPAALVIGGMPEKPQLRELRSGARLLVATPGRLEDFLRRGLVHLHGVKILVLDEADRMLDMGFLPAIRRIVDALPAARQTLLFSATLDSAANLLHEYTSDAARIVIGSTMKPVDSVELRAFEVPSADKARTLRHLLRAEDGRTLVFTRTKHGAERLAKSLLRDGFAAASIHGDRSQSQRTGALAGFADGRFQVLVATDLAARGLQVDDIAHVINYDLPKSAEDFIHRVGRTARLGARGRASSLVSGAEMIELRSIERALDLRMMREQVDPMLSPASPAPAIDSLKRRTLQALPGECFA